MFDQIYDLVFVRYAFDKRHIVLSDAILRILVGRCLQGKVQEDHAMEVVYGIANMHASPGELTSTMCGPVLENVCWPALHPKLMSLSATDLSVVISTYAHELRAQQKHGKVKGDGTLFGSIRLLQ